MTRNAGSLCWRVCKCVGKGSETGSSTAMRQGIVNGRLVLVIIVFGGK